MLNQKWVGDITIVPDITLSNFPELLDNPNEDTMLRFMSKGEKSTWPCMLQNLN
jgi:hypothetical protein